MAKKHLNSFEAKLAFVLTFQALIFLAFFLVISFNYFKIVAQNQNTNYQQQANYFKKLIVQSEGQVIQATLKSFVNQTNAKEALESQPKNLFLTSHFDLDSSNTAMLLTEQGEILATNKSNMDSSTHFEKNIFEKAIITGNITDIFYGHMFKLNHLTQPANARQLFTLGSLKIKNSRGLIYYLVVITNIDKKIQSLCAQFEYQIQEKKGSVQLIHDSFSFKEKMNDAFYFLSILMLGTFLLIAVTTNYFAEYLTKPIRLILTGIQSYAETGYGYKINLDTNDEFNRLADAFNMMIEKSRLALVDPMTNLFNRRYLDAELARCCQSARRKNDLNLSVAVFDIDFFKKINDQHGHAVGDEAICFLAKCLKDNFRTSDVIARFGGEEFVVILKDSHLDGAAEVCERLVQFVAKTSFISVTNGKNLNFTISCGLANATQTNYNPNLLFEFADQALYTSKQSGRNRVTVNSKSTETTNRPGLKIVA